jgi:hypothetical protein
MIAIHPRLFAAAAILLLVGLPAWGEDSPKGKITRTGKASTALVQGKTFGTQGSAFCIHPTGIFLTNEHVVSRESTFTLFLNGGTKKVGVLTAKVLRMDKELDLALLQAEDAKDLPVLPLAAENNLSETDEVIAFGFPFGQRLSLDAKEPPAISVNVGKVTSLREKAGELHSIQLDAVLNPGNSGGPVLNMDGKVVGVVNSGVPGAGVNFAIPINHVQRFLARPELLFTPPALTLANVHEAVEFQVQALTFTPSPQALDLQLILKREGQSGKSLTLKLSEGSYRVRTAAVPRSEGPAKFRLTARYARGSVSAEVEDRTFKVGDRTVPFREVRRLVTGPNPRVWLRDGKLIRGELSGIEAITAQLGPASITLDLSRAADVRLHPAANLATVTATIVARRGEQEVGRVTHPLLIQGVPQPGEEEIFLDLQPAPLAKDVVEYKLDAAIADVAVGGGGRYLILHQPKLRQLAVFDVNQAKVVKSLPAPEGDLKFVAGMDQLVVALPGSRTLQRWNLTTMEQERTAAYPLKGDILALSLGSASHGPLFVLGKEGNNVLAAFCAVTLEDLKRREMVWSKIGNHFAPFAKDLHLRASFDGKAMGMWTGGGVRPAGVTWIRWDYPIARSTYSHIGSGHVIPGPKGKVLFTSLGMFTEIANFPNTNKPYPGSETNGCYLPAHHADYYLYLGPGPSFNLVPPGKPVERKPFHGVAIHKLEVEKPILHLADIEVPNLDESKNKTDFTVDKRFHLIPEAKVLIVIPPSNDRLILHRVDLEEALAKMKPAKK